MHHFYVVILEIQDVNEQRDKAVRVHLVIQSRTEINTDHVSVDTLHLLTFVEPSQKSININLMGYSCYLVWREVANRLSVEAYIHKRKGKQSKVQRKRQVGENSYSTYEMLLCLLVVCKVAFFLRFLIIVIEAPLAHNNPQGGFIHFPTVFLNLYVCK